MSRFKKIVPGQRIRLRFGRLVERKWETAQSSPSGLGAALTLAQAR
jgi:hypothetical protein